MDLNSITGKRGLVLVGAVALVIYVCFAQFKFLERLPNFANRLARIQEAAGTAYTVETRFRSYSNAWSRIQEDPLIGVGPDPTRAKAYGGWQVHNILLLQWYESGLLALIGMSVILTSIAKTCWLSLKNSQSYQQFRMSLSLLLSFVAFGVNTMAMPEVHHRDAWVFAALPLALASAGPWRSLPAKVGG
jgi:O-antigen ligase